MNTKKFNNLAIWAKDKYQSFKSIILISVVCIIFILVMVFLSINRIIDFSSSFVTLSNVSVFITTLIILFTLLEMQKQRVSSYKPQIIISNTSAIINFPEESNPLFFEWINEDIDFTDLKIFERYFSANFRDEPLIKLYNIGMGSAKKISIKWDVDYFFFQNSIRYYADLRNYERIIEYSEGAIGFMDKTTNEFWGVTACLNEGCLDFILPVNIDREPTKIRFPAGFNDVFPILFQYQCHEFNKPDSDSIFSFEKLPPLTLTLSYYDIGDNFYTNQYQIKVHSNAGTLRSETDYRYANLFVYFEINEF